MWIRTWTSIVPAVSLCLALSVTDASTQSRTAIPASPPQTKNAPAGSDAAALAQFDKQVAAYVAWRKSAAGTIGATQTQTGDQAQIASHEQALAEHIRKARATAKPGDIFNPTAAAAFRRIVAADFRGRTAQKQKLVKDEVPEFTPVINQSYPSSAPLATFPATLLTKLPKLPPEVEYRIVTHHLILRDIEANVIVDFVPSVIP